MLTNIPLIMLDCLTGTIILESVGAFILGIRSKSDFLNITLVNILTNPLLVSLSLWININYGLQVRHIAVFFLELLVFIVEASIYKKVLDFKKINFFLLSLILNLCSFFGGLILNYIL